MKLFIFALMAFAAQQAHRHGHAKMSLAFEGASGVMTFDMPSETVYGFEYKPKSTAQKKLVDEKDAFIKKALAEVVVYDNSLGCQVIHDKTEREEEGSHSDLNITFKVKCDKSPRGTMLVLNVQKVLPKLKDIDLQILVDDLQKSVELKNETKVDLK
jgi:hypothetical protein